MGGRVSRTWRLKSTRRRGPLLRLRLAGCCVLLVVRIENFEIKIFGYADDRMSFIVRPAAVLTLNDFNKSTLEIHTYINLKL